MIKHIYFLFQEKQAQTEAHTFLSTFFKVTTEEVNFSLDGIKTKDLYWQIEERLKKTPFDFLIIQKGMQLEMYDTMKRRIAIDFDGDKLNYGRKVIAKDPFLRAIGKNRERVLDISAGLGIDAVFLSQNGHRVVALERNPLLYFLLNWSQRHSINLSNNKLRFEFASGSTFLKSQPNLNLAYDCIYYDPMFPDKEKSALPKQEMVVFRQLVGHDMDSTDVLREILNLGVRTVVKRPVGAEPIIEKPNNFFESKLIRFDIYEGK